MARAAYARVADLPEEPDVVFIRDLDLGGMSVTNDAETVVREVHAQNPGKRIVYQDTDGFWSELVHERGRFMKFGHYRGKMPD